MRVSVCHLHLCVLFMVFIAAPGTADRTKQEMVVRARSTEEIPDGFDRVSHPCCHNTAGNEQAANACC